MNIEELLALQPRFHAVGNNQLVSLTLHPDALRDIQQRVKPGQTTIETGAGSSTIVFALCGARHTCITPDRAEVDRIIAFCGEHGIDISLVNFVVERSEAALCRLEPTNLDFVLIDGWHAFPTAFIDWYFTADRLNIGGHLMVDDTQLWVESTLCAFMAAEPEWEHVSSPGRAFVFKKVQVMLHEKGWEEQQFIISRSSLPALNAMLAEPIIMAQQGNMTDATRRITAVINEARGLKLSEESIAHELASQTFVVFSSYSKQDETLSSVTLLAESLEPRARHHAIAVTHAAIAFHEMGVAQHGKARKHAALAFAFDRRFMRNRGLWSLILRIR